MDRAAKSRGAFAEPGSGSYMAPMSDKRTTPGWTQIPLVRHGLVALGFLLIALTPIVGPIPGPGGVIVFAAGLSLILKYTGWAKRLYVRFKRKHPKKGPGPIGACAAPAPAAARKCAGGPRPMRALPIDFAQDLAYPRPQRGRLRWGGPFHSNRITRNER